MSDRPVYVLAALLVLLASGLFAYKYFVLKVPLTPNLQVKAWDVEVRVDLRAEGGPAKVSFYLPRPNGVYEVADERFISGDFGLGIRRFVDNRLAVWSVRRATGRKVLFYRATVRPARAVGTGAAANPPEVSSPEFTAAERAAADQLLRNAQNQSADLETLTEALLRELMGRADDNLTLLLGESPDLDRKLQLATRLLARAGIPARTVHGIQLEQLARNARRVEWLDVYYGKQWHSFDPVTGEQGLPDRYLAWWRGNNPLVRVDGGLHLNTQIAVTLNQESALMRTRTPGGLLDFSLLSLPVQTQAVYHVLLAVPIGVLLLVLMRNFVGIKTFGTFMPVLIALAFRETQLLWGIVLFCTVVGSGLAFRFYFERLKLLLVPRLASVLIIVVLLMAIISVISYRLGLHRALSVALFPIVIMTMTVERMSIVWEERGAREALEQGAGSLFVAALAYLVMQIEPLRHVIFLYPELLLVILAATILMGRYTGYRLTELIRFREFGGGKRP
ncbi:MAG: UUP1 family membrane protein [Acidiferrobacteraceae bacterium]